MKKSYRTLNHSAMLLEENIFLYLLRLLGQCLVCFLLCQGFTTLVEVFAHPFHSPSLCLFLCYVFMTKMTKTPGARAGFQIFATEFGCCLLTFYEFCLAFVSFLELVFMELHISHLVNGSVCMLVLLYSLLQ